MIITETLNGHTVEDIRRHPDGSVTLYCDSGRTLALYVANNQIEVMPRKLLLPDQPEPECEPSQRMRLLDAFQGYMINYATYDDSGSVTFTCEPLKSNREQYQKSCGHREIRVTHSDGLINELPPVSAVIALEGLAVFGEQHL